MCMGIPMQVVRMEGTYALCEADGKQEQVDMMLVGEQPAGTWILNFLGSAREVLSAEYAQQIRQALSAVQGVMHSPASVDHLFADLIDREPPLPAHLKAQLKPTANTG